MRNYKKILIADSCAGGIALLSRVRELNPNCEFLFLADGQKNPFGLKTREEIIEIIEDWLKFAEQNQCDLLIIACNTASVAVFDKLDFLKEKYKIPIITMVDFLKIACNSNVENIVNMNVAIFGTKFTVMSDLYQNVIKEKKPKKIFTISGTESEHLIAYAMFDDVEQIKKSNDEICKLRNKGIDTFVLSCTCFELLKEAIERFYKNVNIINLNEYIGEILSENVINKSNLINKFDNVKILTTGDLSIWQKNINTVLRIFFHKNIKIEHVKIR